MCASMASRDLVYSVLTGGTSQRSTGEAAWRSGGEIAEGDDPEGGVEVGLLQLRRSWIARLQTVSEETFDCGGRHFGVGDRASRDGAEGKASVGCDPIEVGCGDDALGGAVLADEEDGFNRLGLWRGHQGSEDHGGEDHLHFVLRFSGGFRFRRVVPGVVAAAGVAGRRPR